MTSRLLVVGGGQAAVQLACSVRDLGWQHPITIVGDECALPYQRPPLSKAFLAGKADAESLALRSAEFLTGADIEFISGERVTRITAAGLNGRDHGTALTETGRTVDFSQLVLTVGARPRRLQVPGNDLAGIAYLRNLDDAQMLRTELDTAQNVVIVGGGFIGLEAAAVARTRGLKVTVLATGPLVGRVVAPVVSEFYRQAHTRRGTDVRIGDAVVGFVGHAGRVTGVELADGTTLPADLVIVGIGVLPNTELAEQLGLVCDNGIVVDENARTSHPAIHAAGDCTVTPHPSARGSLVRLESVQNAIEQAKCAAASIAGQPQAYCAVPWFWSDQADLKLQIAGLSAGFDRTVVRGEPSDEKFSVLYFRDDQLIAIDAINSPRDFMAVRRALAAGRTIDPAKAADVSMALSAA